MAIYISQAFPQDSRRVRVWLSTVPAHSSASRVGDALNPATWQVSSAGPDQLDAAFHVLAASYIPPDLINGDRVDVVVAEPFLGPPNRMQVFAPTLTDSDGGAFEGDAPTQFRGIAESADRPAAQLAPTTPIDIRNRQLPVESYGGTLVMTPEGDYATESGAPLLKKLIVRRLLTAPGDFFHLPDYGLGLREKKLYTADRLAAIKRQCEKQVMLEPEVAAASAAVSMDPSGVLTVALRVRERKTGLPFGVTVSQAGVVL